MKTPREALELEISLFRWRVEKLEWFFDAIERGELKEGMDFFLFDGTEYTLCICHGMDDKEYDIDYSVKHTGEDANLTYIEMECYSLYLATREGLTVHPIL